MKQISPEGVDPYFYYGYGETVPKHGDIVSGFQVYYGNRDPYMHDNLARLPNVRFVLIPTTLKRGTVYASYLHWETVAETAEIDKAVEEDRYTDSDFENSVRTVYSRHICFGCQRRWHALIMDPGELYLPAKGLSDMKLASREAKRCPACGAAPRQLVVMFIEEAVESFGSAGQGAL